MGKKEDQEAADIDRSFQMLSGNLKASLMQETIRMRDDQWKTEDPESYKKDMEQMCKHIFGDRWRTEYDAMLREEFPEEFMDSTEGS
jgi:hypothetical protein